MPSRRTDSALVVVSPPPARQLVPVVSFPDDVIEASFMFWSSVAGRNAEATRRRLEADSPTGAAVPSARTIRGWAIARGWAERADAELRSRHSQRLYALQSQMFAAVEAGIETLLLAQAGAFDDDPMAGALRIKACDVALRAVERGVFPLMPPPPQVAERAWETMSREEREAYMRDSLHARKTP
jgi:hypothetical protein